MSKSLIAQQKMIKTPPLLVMSKIKNYRASSTHMTVCQCNWPISWPPPHWPLGRTEKKNGRHIWPNYDIKNFFQKKFKCTPCPQYWTVTSTLVPLEHSRKQQNVGYTDATIGCSLKQPKNTKEPLHYDFLANDKCWDFTAKCNFMFHCKWNLFGQVDRPTQLLYKHNTVFPKLCNLIWLIESI